MMSQQQKKKQKNNKTSNEFWIFDIDTMFEQKQKIEVLFTPLTYLLD